VRRVLLPSWLLLACCASTRPGPYLVDRTTPEKAFESFRSAVEAGDHDQEFDFFSQGLRAKLGMRSRHDWQDARVTVLTQGHRVIRAILRSRLAGEPETLPDGRVRMPIRVRFLVFRFSGQVWLRRLPVLRIFYEGEERPAIYDPHLHELRLEVGEGSLGVAVPSDLVKEAERGRAISRFEARKEWFLDDFAVGSQTPARVKQDVERSGKDGPKGDKP
jgi:hypothetical protein